MPRMNLMKFSKIFTHIYLWVIVLCSSILCKEVAKFAYRGQPERLMDSTIKVPSKMVALSEYQYVGKLSDSTFDTTNLPAIMFLIDNSGSMSVGATGADKRAHRFKITSSLIDTIYNKIPNAEIGLTVFGTYLIFEPDSNPLFKPDPILDTGGYIPFLRLNQFYNGQSGYEILKNHLKLTYTYTTTNPPDTSWILAYKSPWIWKTSTNINSGFAGVKDGCNNTAIKKENQFVIFFSDGAASYPYDPPGEKDRYIEGKDVPTTFTIYFLPKDTTGNNIVDTVPTSLKKMTENIRANRYSSMNPKSNYWGFHNSGYDTLMNFVMKNVVNVILTKINMTPSGLTVNNGQQVNNWNQSAFTLPSLLPLTDVTTDFSFDIKYNVTKDSVDEYGNIHQVQFDSTTHVDYRVEVDPNQPALNPAHYEVKSWDRDLGFYSNNAQVSIITDTMNQLEIRFTFEPGSAQYNYTKASVTLGNTSSRGREREQLTLTKNGRTFSATINRTLIPDNASPNQDNGTLQHYMDDTLTALFKNDETPRLPLDSLEISVPFTFGGTVSLAKAAYFDNDAEGYIDSIAVEASTSIQGGLTTTHITEIVDKAITLPGFRNFTVTGSGLTSEGFYIAVTEDKSHDPMTSVTADDKLTIKQHILSTGGSVEAASIAIVDKVAPIIHWKERSALLYDYKSTGKKDTLGVRFSEEIQSVSSNEPFYFLKTNNGQQYSAQLNPINQPKPDSLIFEVTSVNGVSEIVDGDSLWIHETDKVKDNAGNAQNNNKNSKRKVYVQQVYGSVFVDHGYYFDLNADGFIDSIAVKASTDIDGGFTQAIIDEMVQNAITLPSYRNFTVLAQGMTSDGFYIKVVETREYPVTSVTGDDKLNVSSYVLTSGGNVVEKSAVLLDRIAPLIHWDEKSAYAIVHQDTTISDSIYVTFSEPIKQVSHEVPFYFLSKMESKTYTAKLKRVNQPKPEQLLFEVLSLADNIDKLRGGDSIWIHESDRVGDLCKDLSGNSMTNFQNNPHNTKRELFVERRLIPFTMLPKAASPVNRNNLVTDKFINIFKNDDNSPNNIFEGLKLEKSGDGYIGMVINVVPDRLENVFAAFRCKGELSILDAVGNRVIESRKMGWDEKNKRLIFVWNLKNSNNRYVGSGMYVCLIEIEETTKSSENSGLKEVKKILVGVK